MATKTNPAGRRRAKATTNKAHSMRTLLTPAARFKAPLLILLLVLGVAVGYFIVHFTRAAGCTVDAKLVNSCRPWLGAWATNYPQAGGGFKAQINYHEQRIGRQLDIVHNYHSPSSHTLNSDDIALANRANTILYINWKPTSTWSQAGGGNATVNGYIDQMAASIKNVNGTASHKVMVALPGEPERYTDYAPSCGSGFNYRGGSGTTTDYVKMWHNVRARFDAKGVTNVVWVMNYMGLSKWQCMQKDLWPGNSYVDWVMWDPYAGSNETYASSMGYFYNWMTANADADHAFTSKPWGLSEYGSYTTTQSASYKYYDDMKTSLDNNTYPRLKAYLIFDATGEGTWDTRVGYNWKGSSTVAGQLANDTLDATEQAHFKAFAADPRLTDAYYGGTGSDTTAPSAPSGLAASSVSATSIGLKWSASTDTGGSGLAGYDVYRGGAKIGASTTTSFTDSTVSASTAYSYYVKARDAAGNVSAASSTLSVKTLAPPDTTAPSVPTGLTGKAASQTQVNLSWAASTDTGGSGLAGYHVYRGNTKLADVATTSYSDSTLAAATSYNYAVSAYDKAGNTSSLSPALTIVTPVDSLDAPGLSATYFNNQTLSGLGLNRTDQGINFNWDTNAPLAGISADHFSARWTGRLTIPTSGTYTFYTTTDDGVRLWVNDRLIIDNWTDHPATTDQASASLNGNTQYNIKLEYYENGGKAVAQLAWSGPGIAKNIIAGGQFATSMHGLLGTYYADASLGTATLARIDSAVNFNWGKGAPDAQLPIDNYSVRWTGKVLPQYSQIYTFYTVTDDGLRLWVDGRLLIDNWADHSAKERSGTITLTAGVKYDIKMEYYEHALDSSATLSWSSASVPKQIIPENLLFDR